MFEELQAISERVARIKSIEAADLRVVVNLVASFLQSLADVVQAVHKEGRMRLCRRAEVRIDPQMNLKSGRSEPTSPAWLQMSRLVDLLKAKYAAVEFSGIVLGALGYHQLHMMEPSSQFTT